MTMMKRALGMLTILTLTLAGCGGGEDSVVTARNLSTGEVQSFGSEAEVPPDWAICADAACTVPPKVACEKLSAKVCPLQPDCRLKELWCMGSGTVCSSGSTCPPPPPPTCEYTCIPKLPLLCDELTDQKVCGTRADCEWAQGACPAIACAPGTICPPCTFSCRAKTPPLCSTLDEKACGTRKDCTWAPPEVCPMMCPAADCGCNTPVCQPAKPPTSCKPADCPSLGMPNYLCPDGKTVAGPTGNCLPTPDGTCGPEIKTCPTPPPPTTCKATDCGPALGMPNYLCPDGKTVAGPTGKCLASATGTCGWEVVTCPPTPPATCIRTGCSGTVCSDKPLAGTCEWSDYYQCYDLAKCGATGSTCGWIQTPDFVACLAKYGKKP
jgi:hypothetical protein